MKIAKINTCNNCPYLRWNWKGDYCGERNGKKIKDIDTIPKWCPLQDYKENKP